MGGSSSNEGLATPGGGRGRGRKGGSGVSQEDIHRRKVPLVGTHICSVVAPSSVIILGAKQHTIVGSSTNQEGLCDSKANKIPL